MTIEAIQNEVEKRKKEKKRKGHQWAVRQLPVGLSAEVRGHKTHLKKEWLKIFQIY